jgi:hypothetical protein
VTAPFWEQARVRDIAQMEAPMTDKADGKRWRSRTILATTFACYLAGSFTLVTLDGLGRLNPTLGHATAPIVRPLLWLMWISPPLNRAFSSYLNWLDTFR